MNSAKTYSYFILVLCFFSTSCFYKSPKTGVADDLDYTIICHTPKGDYLITHEEVFQASSKSSGPKGTYISGSADYRFTVRNLQTGIQATRLVTGDREKDMLPLGFDGNQLWFYSADKSVGLHARNPGTLDITITQKQIEEANPSFAGKLNTPTTTYDAKKFYSYDPVNNQITVLDLQGNLYGIDPATLHAVPLIKKSAFLQYLPSAFSTSAYFGIVKSVTLKGESRMHIDVDGIKSEESYLKGQILLEQDLNRLSHLSKKMRANLDVSNPFIPEHSNYDRTRPFDPSITSPKNYHETPYKYIPTSSELKEDSLRNVQNALRDKTAKDYKALIPMNNMVLGCDSNIIYIIHANNLADTSSLLISKINTKGNKFITQWTTLVPKIYFNPSDGIKKDDFGTLKAGNPKFRYEWYGKEGNVFIGIKMLFAFALDDSTGKMLWKQQL